MRYEYIPGSNYKAPPSFLNLSERSFCLSDEGNKSKRQNNIISTCFQYVNPSLLLQWQGQSKSNQQISGPGIFRAYQRSKDGNHKSKLVLSLQSTKWKNGKPNGQTKMIETIYYQLNRQDNIIKQIRKFNGKMENMMKEGYGQYSFQYFYSNQTKKIIQIKGQWKHDFLSEADIYQNGVFKEKIQFSNNVQSNPNKQIAMENIELKMMEKKQFKIKLQAIQSNNKLMQNQANDTNQNMNEKETKKQEKQQKTINLLVPPTTTKLKNNAKIIR